MANHGSLRVCLLISLWASATLYGQTVSNQVQSGRATELSASSEQELEPGSAQTSTEESREEMRLRDPFWPVGFHPENKDTGDGTTAERLAESVVWPQLELKGITRGPSGSYFAILDGIGLVEEGQVITQKRDRMIFRWRIDTITEKGLRPIRLEVLPEGE